MDFLSCSLLVKMKGVRIPIAVRQYDDELQASSPASTVCGFIFANDPSRKGPSLYRSFIHRNIYLTSTNLCIMSNVSQMFLPFSAKQSPYPGIFQVSISSSGLPRVWLWLVERSLFPAALWLFVACRKAGCSR